MKRLAFALAAVALASLPLLNRADEPPASTEKTMHTVAELAFMSGTWALESGPMRIEEQWSTPGADHMLGTCRFMRDGKLSLAEFLTIEQGAEGVRLYLMHYGAAMTRKHDDPLTFSLQSVENKKATFNNLEDEFPQVYTYELKEDGTLLASISGTKGGKPSTQAFPYKKIE